MTLSTRSSKKLKDILKKKMGWLDDFKEFSADTSAHGVKYVFHGSHKVVKILFLIIWLAAIAYAMYVISNSIFSFIGKPTGTKFQVIASTEHGQERKPASILFPTISVCSHNVLSKKYLEGQAGLEELWMELDKWDTNNSKHIDFNKTYSKYKDITSEDVIVSGGPSLGKFLQCEAGLGLCKDAMGDDYVTREASVSGNCYRINPKGKLRGKGGDYGKMQLMFFADLNDYSNITRREPQYGYTVVFHDHESYSSTIPSGVWMSPGSIYKVDLSMTREFREPPPAGTCNPYLINNTYGRYEENSCVAQCRDDAMIEACGCVHISPPVPENSDKSYPACTLQEWAKCGQEAYVNWVKAYSNVDNDGDKQMCSCPGVCQETRFKAQISASMLSKFYAEDKKSLLKYIADGYSTKEDVMQNLLIVDVLYTSMQVSEIREIVTYGWGNFLGDVGGVLGLFLGASAFTIIEFAQFTAFAIGKYCFGCKNNGKPGGDHIALDQS